MIKKKYLFTILMAEDDPDDRFLAEEALLDTNLGNGLQCVENGEELMAYLRRQGEYIDSDRYPWPRLILLDLNMPRKDGREAIAEIKADPALRHIPIVVLTTSRAEEDIIRTYDLGVNSYIAKPVTFDGLVKAMQNLTDYWFDTVSLPTPKM